MDITKNGDVKWSVDTGDSLLSSSIHRLELTTNGKWVRMIPSLSGGLYKFDGETIEAIPIKAEDLLKSSFKFSDDIVISGGIEKNSYGVSTHTGEILYQCSIRGCTNYTVAEDQANKNEHHDALLDDVMIVRRETQTVRAVDPRSGVERWNFSIGQHELELMKSKDCQGGGKNEQLDTLLLDLEIRAVIPEGIICAFSKKDPAKMLWMKKFSYPIVSAWKSGTLEDNIEHIDFFSSADWLWNGQSGLFSQSQKPDDEGNEQQVSPSIYLGMYEKQPYIQESNTILQLSQEKQYQGTNIITDDHSDFKFRVPFRPFPANKKGIQLIEDHSEDQASEIMVPGTTEAPEVPTNALATSVLYASEYVNGNGFFFYPEMVANKTVCDSQNKTKEKTFDEPDDIDFSLMARIHALTFYWNEVVIIIVTTAVFVYFFIRNSRTSERVSNFDQEIFRIL